ncbi:MAG TPA: L-fucose:H+ symporter permease [Steroidobacteraceae bacterium]|nr:L-fucose:H+ symporter permease [Steroidobacteraceae bacterium]
MSSDDISDSPPRAAPASAGAYAFALIASLFFLWGVANNLNDILIKQFKNAFELSDFRAGLVQSAFYAGYFLLAIPASLCTRRFGYRSALLVGLGLYAVGAFLFYPAAALRTYGLFLGALFVIACGLAFLETSANPLVTVLGPPQGATRRLNLAQSFNPLGSITGVLIGQQFIFSGVEPTRAQITAMTESARAAYYASQSSAVQMPYVVIGCVVLLWALLIGTARLPIARAEPARHPGGAQVRTLLGNRNFILAVLAQFFYVGAQVGIWSYLIRYAQQTVAGTSQRHAANFLTISLALFMLGRFAGTALMRYLAPARLLAGFATAALALAVVAVLFPGRTGVAALIAVSFFMSIMFPTIFALGLRGLGDEARKMAAPFLVMAIVGGATLTLLMGAISDAAGIQRAMSVPALCFAVVLGFATYTRRLTTAV